jgi:LysR family transcriptional regulator, benzoate and cis,cis-muconate-responsive activator of ben and cat genes
MTDIRLARSGLYLYLPGMELRHLRYFAAVARRLSFSRAAEDLHVSQPPLSRQIQDMERELGTALFDRKGKRIELTKAGEFLSIEVPRILDGIEMALRTASAIGGSEANSLRIGCVNFLMYATLPPLFETLRELEPDMRIELSVMSTEAQERALKAGALDLGFVRSWVTTGLIFEPLATERLALIFPPAAKVDEDPQSCIRALAERPFIAISTDAAPGLSDKIRSICAEYGCIPDIGYVCGDAYSIVKLVGAGLGWSIVPDMAYRDAAAADVGIVMLPQTMALGLCYAKPVLSERERRFVELAKEYFSARVRDEDA